LNVGAAPPVNDQPRDGPDAPGPGVQMLTPHIERPRVQLIGEGGGIAATIALADGLRGRTDAAWQPLVLLGSEEAFPFRARPSLIVVAGIPDGCIACMPLLDGWGIASRLASRADFPGCFDGVVTALADTWLSTLSAEGLAGVEIFACGPALMLEGAAGLARRYGVPWQAQSFDSANG
jgi:dihydroorotate dehydrogenase electron transfer subunit